MWRINGLKVYSDRFVYIYIIIIPTILKMIIFFFSLSFIIGPCVILYFSAMVYINLILEEVTAGP